MNRIMSKISKEILTRQEAHVITYKQYQLQQRLEQACKDDKSHSRSLSE